MSCETQELVVPINRLEQELGDLTSVQKEQVKEILQRFMTAIREILSSEDPVCSTVTKKQCDTCALNPRTDSWPGFMATAYSFLSAVSAPRRFMCHANQENWRENLHDLSTLEDCSGFRLVLMIDREACFKAAYQAITDIRQVVPQLKKL